jgi:hypothetical protein
MFHLQSKDKSLSSLFTYKVVYGTFDYTATQIGRTLNGKVCEETMFCLNEIVRHTMLDSAGVALNQVHYMI